MPTSSVTRVLDERILNFREDDVEKKQVFADYVYDMLQAAYAPVGGLKGSGFSTPEEMVSSIPFWKVARVDGEVVAVMMYKNKSGRKRVTMASDGTEIGKKALAKMMLEDMLQGRAYVEVSGPALSFMKKQMGADPIKAHVIAVDRVRRVLPTDDILTPVPDTDPDLVRHPDLAEYFYQRELAGHLHTKIMFGNPAVL